MTTADSAIHHVSDTALLIAGCRAAESARKDAFFRDPYAERLAGPRGLAMVRALAHPMIMEFGIAVRTRFLDDLILQTLSTAQIQTVVSLGSGLDTRPWRLELPPELNWIEVDLPAILDYKEEQMQGQPARCRRQRLTIDLNDSAQRNTLFHHLGRQPCLMITEGLLMYLPGSTVQALAVEARQKTDISHWLTDITTSSFTNAIGGGGSTLVSHVQAPDHLKGEQILATLLENGWATRARLSYIRDLSFAAQRLAQIQAASPKDARPPAFDPAEPSGVHLFGVLK